MLTRPKPTRAKSRGRAFQLDKARLRILDIKKVIADLFEDGAATTDDADVFLKLAAPSLMHAGGGPGEDGAYSEVMKFRARHTPGIGEDEATKILREVEREALHGRKVHVGPDEAAELLGITPERMWRLNLKSINAIGLNAKQRKAEYQKREKARQQANRDKAGCTRQADSKAARIRALALELGISESTVKRRIASGKLTLAPATSTCDPVSYAIGSSEPPLARTDLVHCPGQTHEGPARIAKATRTRPAGGLTPRDLLRSVAASHPGAPSLPSGGSFPQGDLFGTSSEAASSQDTAPPAHARESALAALDDWHEGLIPPPAMALISGIAHARDLRSRAAVARDIGIERPTLVNAWVGRYGLGPEKVAAVKAWIGSHLSRSA